MAVRKPISSRLRFNIFKRDGFVCQYCGAHPPNCVLHVDHIVAIANGGSNDIDNLVTACDLCNFGKAAILLESVPLSLTEKAKLIAEKEAQLKGYNAVFQARRERLETDTWEVVDQFGSYCSRFPEDWFLSIQKFVDRLGKHEVIDAMISARAKIPWSNIRRFKYFCGVCWGKVRNVEGQENGKISSASALDG